MADSGWTVDTLKEHFDARFDAMDVAITKADAANEKRLDNVNEFRATLETQQGTFVTKGQVAWAITAFFLALGAATAIFAALSRGG